MTKKVHHGMRHNKWLCDGCGAVLGKVSPAADGGRLLDITAPVVVLPRNPYEPGSFTFCCPCGHLFTWKGDAMTVKSGISNSGQRGS